MVGKRVQHVLPNNIARCCVEMLQALRILLALKRNKEHFLGKENKRTGRNDTADPLSNCESMRLKKKNIFISKAKQPKGGFFGHSEVNGNNSAICCFVYCCFAGQRHSCGTGKFRLRFGELCVLFYVRGLNFAGLKSPNHVI